MINERKVGESVIELMELWRCRVVDRDMDWKLMVMIYVGWRILCDCC